MRCFLIIILSLISRAFASFDLPPVEQSEYASVGKTGVYVGNVNDVSGLRTALKECSYRNETIFISTTEHFVDAAAQTMDMLR